MARAIIAALSPEGVIGLDGRLPWHYSADLARFKRLTVGTTVIMGRLTWESLPKRPLPKRRNLVVTGRTLPGVECFRSPAAAAAASTGDVWFIGGARIFAAAMELADRIDLTYVPDHVDPAQPGAVLFPSIDETIWRPGPLVEHEGDPALRRRVFERRAV